MNIRIQRWFTPWRWRRRTWFAFLPVAFVLYLLIPAPMARLSQEFSGVGGPALLGRYFPSVAIGNDILSDALFGPANWLYDHTTLQEPLLRWAALWGVEDQFEDARVERKILPELKEVLANSPKR